MIEKLPLRAPPMLADACGYTGDSRYVAFWWEPCGDELTWDDGRCLLCGASWHAWLLFVQHHDVAPYLHAYDFGSSETEAVHALLLDRDTGQLHAGPIAEVRAFLAREAETWPLPRIARIDAMSAFAPLDSEAVARAMLRDRALYEQLRQWLDENSPVVVKH